MSKKLKNCPFCGRDDLIPSYYHTEEGQKVCVACEECGAEGPPVAVSKEDRAAAFKGAAKLWNARVN